MKNSILKCIKLYERQKGLCPYCGDKLTEQKSIHIDHIHPKSKGGTLEYDNSCLACQYCNLRKKDNDVNFIIEWLKPYKEGIVKNKKDLKDYHNMITLLQKFNN